MISIKKPSFEQIANAIAHDIEVKRELAAESINTLEEYISKAEEFLKDATLTNYENNFYETFIQNCYKVIDEKESRRLYYENSTKL